MKKNQLTQRLVNICSDYQNNRFDFSHVEEWVNQFPSEHHIIILENLINIFEQTYFSKNYVEQCLSLCLADNKLFPDKIGNYGFLNIQNKGSSQEEMLDILINNSSVPLNIVDDSTVFGTGNYVYIDDCFYSGNTLHRDIERWASNVGEENIKSLTIIYLGFHSRQYNYIFETILPSILPRTTISPYLVVEFIDKESLDHQYDSFLPCDHGEYTINAQNYIDEIAGKRSDKANMFYPIVRPVKNLRDNYFINNEERSIIETLFFEEGVKLQSKVVKPQFKPMGYDSKPTLGFGSFFVSYRNVPNNCPLVFWWGDKDKSYLGEWIPLFTRVVN